MRIKLLIGYYNTIPTASMHKIYTKSIFLEPHNSILSYCYVSKTPLNAQNEDMRSLFIGIFGQCSTQFLVLSTRVSSQMSFLLSSASYPSAQHLTFPYQESFLGCSTSWICALDFLQRRSPDEAQLQFVVLNQKVKICYFVFSISMA